MFKLPRTSAIHPTHLYMCCSCRFNEVRTTPNQCISTLNTLLYLCQCGSCRFDEVPYASTTPNQCISGWCWFDEVRCARTTPKQCMVLVSLYSRRYCVCCSTLFFCFDVYWVLIAKYMFSLSLSRYLAFVQYYDGIVGPLSDKDQCHNQCSL